MLVHVHAAVRHVGDCFDVLLQFVKPSPFPSSLSGTATALAYIEETLRRAGGG